MERRCDGNPDDMTRNTLPSTTPVRSQVWRRALGLVALFGLLLIPHLGLQNYVYDDAYIHLRLAMHLVQNGHPYFNPGEAVNAGSSPVWTVIVAGILLLSAFHPVGLAALGALISTFGVVAFVYLVNGEFHLSWMERIVLGAVYLAITLPSSIGWMETPLALLVAWVAMIRYRGARSDAFVLAGLIPFIRPELVILSGIILTHAISARKMRLQRVLAWAAVGAAPFVIYELAFFGTLMPNTVAAKSVVYSLTYGDAIASILSSCVPALRLLLPAAQWLDTIPLVVALPTATVLVLYVAGIPRTKPAFLFVALAGCGLALGAAYAATKTLIFPWYSPLYLTPLLGALALGLKRPYAGWSASAARVLAAPLLVVWTVAFVQVLLSSFVPRMFPDYEANARARSYLRIGSELHAKYPDAHLMTSEIGALGYAFGGFILDGAGLVTPEALRYHPLSIPRERDSGFVGAIPTRFIGAAEPEIIVSMPVFMKDFVRRGDTSNYIEQQEPLYLPEDAVYLGDNLWGSRGITVFVRRDIFQAELPN